MTDALTQSWADIRKRSKNTVPRAVIAVTPGKSGSTCGSVTWTDDPVLLADTATLGKAPLEILGWLLHLAAHGKADTGRKPSQSSEGRYHDAAYKQAAEALGLEVTTGPGSGWSRTTVPKELAGRYLPAIERLRAALQTWEPPVTPARAVQGKRPPNQTVAWCSCDPPAGSASRRPRSTSGRSGVTSAGKSSGRASWSLSRRAEPALEC